MSQSKDSRYLLVETRCLESNPYEKETINKEFEPNNPIDGISIKLGSRNNKTVVRLFCSPTMNITSSRKDFFAASNTPVSVNKRLLSVKHVKNQDLIFEMKSPFYNTKFSDNRNLNQHPIKLQPLQKN